MDKVRIGIYDEELDYVLRFSAFMNKVNKGRWRVSGFTEPQNLNNQVQKGKLDLLLSTDEKLISVMRKNYPQLNCVYLSSGGEPHAEDKGRIYRFQSARVIAEEIQRMVDGYFMLSVMDKSSLAIYSPVSRCGKTTLLLELIEGGGWLYIGMEDYGYIKDYDERQSDDFFYYIKERQKDKVIEIIKSSRGVIPSPFYFSDTRRINREDIEWFLSVFEGALGYKGVVFDIGLGVLIDLNMLTVFDKVVVPYINDDISMGKKRHFEETVGACELEDLLERIIYIDMKNEPYEHMRRLMQ
ncbi:MAG: hypothetical protein E7271_00105 [Lachnospiraceae bacterium]|jgi:hypothetical protein|nr:hypothetical protein [Lachnospiraceae bacterium]